MVGTSLYIRVFSSKCSKCSSTTIKKKQKNFVPAGFWLIGSFSEFTCKIYFWNYKSRKIFFASLHKFLKRCIFRLQFLISQEICRKINTNWQRCAEGQGDRDLQSRRLDVALPSPWRRTLCLRRSISTSTSNVATYKRQHCEWKLLSQKIQEQTKPKDVYHLSSSKG